MLLKLLKVTVEVHVHVALKSTFKGFTPKAAAWKTEFFAYFISHRQSAHQQKQSQNLMFFMSEQDSLPKTSSILQK